MWRVQRSWMRVDCHIDCFYGIDTSLCFRYAGRDGDTNNSLTSTLLIPPFGVSSSLSTPSLPRRRKPRLPKRPLPQPARQRRRPPQQRTRTTQTRPFQTRHIHRRPTPPRRRRRTRRPPSRVRRASPRPASRGEPHIVIFHRGRHALVRSGAAEPQALALRVSCLRLIRLPPPLDGALVVRIKTHALACLAAHLSPLL